MPKKRKEARKGAETIRVPSLQYDQNSRRLGSLLVVQGADADLGRHVTCDRPITIGREDDNGLALSDGSISRRHCSVERDGKTGIYVLVDLGSTNGTVVNGRTIGDRYPLTEGDKIILGASVVKFSFADLVDLQYQSRVEAMVSTDALTGMASRRQYDITFDSMARKAEAAQSLLTLMVMDMDGLKEINDTYGHQTGGDAIVAVSTLIRATLDEHGRVCRYGGDEFVGCFPGLARERGMTLAETVRHNIEAHEFECNGHRVAPTLSIGLATFPGDCDKPAELFTIADRALYKAKRSGRNQVATPDAREPDPEAGTTLL